MEFRIRTAYHSIICYTSRADYGTNQVKQLPYDLHSYLVTPLNFFRRVAQKS